MPLAMSAGFDVLDLIVRTSRSFAVFQCGKRVRRLGWSRITDLAQSGECQLREERQAQKSRIDALRLSAILRATVQSIGQHKGN